MSDTDDPDLAATLQAVAGALAEMSASNPAPYAARWADSDDVTLFDAWGPIERGHEPVTRTFTWVGSRFSGGPRCRRGRRSRRRGGEPQQMTLRVTHVYKRVDGQWRLMHRHADFPPADQRDDVGGRAGGQVAPGLGGPGTTCRTPD
jgi:ketosteroid isomerase-like protein